MSTESLNQAPASNRDDGGARAPIRLWPAVVIVLLAAIAMPAGRFIPRIRDVGQHRSIWLICTGGPAVIGLVGWFVFASRLPWRVRRAGGAGIVVLVAGTALAFRIEGVTGDLRPIISPRFRWHSASSERPAESVQIALVETPEDYPQFLGPHRDAMLPNVRLETDWQARPPKLLWRRPVGEAWSAFAVVGDYAITQEQSAVDEQIACYELRSGKPIWRYQYPAEFRSVIAGTGPRATPTVVDGRVYATGATGILVCLDGSTGHKVWSRDAIADAAAVPREWGDSCSPLVLDDKVIVTGGQQGWSLIAYQREDGQIAWHGGDSYPGYASPRLATLCGVPQILVLNHMSVAAHDPGDGRVLWEHAFGAGHAAVADPIPVDDNRVFVSSGYGYGCLLIELARGEDGQFKTSEVWPRNPRLKMKFTNGVVHQGCVFGLDDGVLACLEIASGKRRWRAGRYGHGQIMLVGDLLLVQAESGEIVLVRANPAKHEELARFQALDGKTWNNPVLAGSLLLVRNDKEAACYELPLARQ